VLLAVEVEGGKEIKMQALKGLHNPDKKSIIQGWRNKASNLRRRAVWASYFGSHQKNEKRMPI